MGLRTVLSVLLLATSGLGGATAALQKVLRVPYVQCEENNAAGMTIYDFQAQDIHKMKNISLSEYRGKQEPGNNGTEILNGIQYVRPGSNFIPAFPMFEKVQVNGETEHPLFTFLKSQCPSTRDGHSAKEELWYKPLRSTDIRWNFEKFLIGKNGLPVKRYDASTNPMDIMDDVQLVLRRPYYSAQAEDSEPQQTSTSSAIKNLPTAAFLSFIFTILYLTR